MWTLGVRRFMGGFRVQGAGLRVGSGFTSALNPKPQTLNPKPRTLITLHSPRGSEADLEITATSSSPLFQRSYCTSLFKAVSLTWALSVYSALRGRFLAVGTRNEGSQRNKAKPAARPRQA